MGEPTGTLEMAHNGFKPAELATEMIFQVSKDVVMAWDSLRCCSSDLGPIIHLTTTAARESDGTRPFTGTACLARLRSPWGPGAHTKHGREPLYDK